ncbi:hypothetical protein BRAO375_2000029 [Bradyrhizobium sp. ORS 375]|nr:hypothetical protein BRAO375_2000029 [Bradyrhizobium sp. ORS 375]
MQRSGRFASIYQLYGTGGRHFQGRCASDRRSGRYPAALNLVIRNKVHKSLAICRLNNQVACLKSRHAVATFRRDFLEFRIQVNALSDARRMARFLRFFRRRPPAALAAKHVCVREILSHAYSTHSGINGAVQPPSLAGCCCRPGPRRRRLQLRKSR